MVNKGGVWGLEVLNLKLLKIKFLVLLIIKDFCKFKLVLGLKIILLGLIRNRFVLFNIFKVFRRLDILVLVILVNIFLIKVGLVK